MYDARVITSRIWRHTNVRSNRLENLIESKKKKTLGANIFNSIQDIESRVKWHFNEFLNADVGR